MNNTNPNRLFTIDGETLMSKPLQPLNFVVDTLISQGLHILAGSPKVGKSWLALWLAVTVAKGEPVWGLPVKRGTYVGADKDLMGVVTENTTITLTYRENSTSDTPNLPVLPDIPIVPTDDENIDDPDVPTGDGENIDDNDTPLAGLATDDHFAYIIGYEDGTIRPTNNLTREEAAMIFYRLMTAESRAQYGTEEHSFNDVKATRWSNRAIATLANAGILKGYPDGGFHPQAYVTRAELAAIAARFDNVEEGIGNQFSDTKGHWAEELISFAAYKGWVNGYEDGTFRPNQNITRAEAMKLINRVLGRQVDAEGLTDDARQWPDNDANKWYYGDVMEATTAHDYERREEGGLVENWTKVKENTPQQDW